jgi:DNA-binding CsgD family transcriptional regulator
VGIPCLAAYCYQAAIRERDVTRVRALQPSVEKLYDAALVGDGWSDALETLSRAGGSRGVMLMHNRNRKLLASITNAEIREPVAQYLAGDAPPNSRQTRVSFTHDVKPGFVVDYDDYDVPEIARDPYYQEFLRPLGLGWHANARVKIAGGDEIAISFKRELKAGPYDEADKRTLNRLLPHLKVITRLAESVFDAETRGMVRALHQRGRPVLEFDAWGLVRRQHGSFDGSRGPLTVVGARVTAAEPTAQSQLDAAIFSAARFPRRPAPLLLNDRWGNRYVFQIIPILGRARDVFSSSSALGVLIGQPRRNSLIIDRDLAIALFGLSVREAQIVAQLCEGASTAEISISLRIVPETVRFHLKSIFEKTGVHRQTELVALLAPLSQ